MQENAPMKIVQMVMGTREDHVPFPIQGPYYIWLCARCDEKTYTQEEYPLDSTIVCNVCAGELAEQAKHSSSTKAVIQPSERLNESMKRISNEKRSEERRVGKECRSRWSP